MRFAALVTFVIPALFAGACSSSSSALPVKHSCSLDTTNGNCFCDAFTGDGDDEPSQSGACSAAAFSGAVCCASPGWPGTEQNGSTGGCSCVTGSITSCPPAVDTTETISVESCDFGSTPVGGGSGTDSGAPVKCTDPGYCGPDGDNCECGTECIHYGPGEYLCGFDCAKTSDCAGKKDPVSGSAITACNPGLQTDTEDYDGYCVSQ